MLINGKEVELKFDFGMARLFKAETGKDMLALKGDGFADTDVMAGFIYAAAKRGNPKITMDDIDSIPFSELQSIVSEMTGNMPKFDDPLAKNPQE
jgi:hypothetical protein